AVAHEEAGNIRGAGEVIGNDTKLHVVSPHCLWPGRVMPLKILITALNMFTSASNAGFGREDDSAVIKI
ncbi:hypothetical protein QMN72_29675, partial [Klebsiella pneumoniae]|nr:hypothetical protein [Klebsiella pneumoniae]